MKIDLKELYLTVPFGKTFHIFDKEDNRSLCGKAAMIFVNEAECEEVTGKEVYRRGQDCKACFRAAGLKLEKAWTTMK